MGRASLQEKSVFLYDWGIDEDSKPKCVMVAPVAGRLVSAKLHSSATVTAADTNYNTFTLQQGTTALATLANGPATGGVNVTAAGGAFTLTSADTWAAAAVLSLKSVKTGNGLAVADCTLSFIWEPNK